MNRYLVDTVKREMLGHGASRQAEDVSENTRRVGMVPPLALTSGNDLQDNHQADSEHNGFQFGACSSPKAKEDQDELEQEKCQGAHGHSSQKPTMYVKPRATK